ncbi:phosphate ABC transporter substrate-binding protein, partial [Bilophila wadsworthia]
PFAIDGVALVVNPANNVSDITAQQAADIYNGKITNWKELGGTDAPITLYTREDGSGTREVFVERALNKGSIVQSANVVNSNGAMKTAVAQDKQSIGYVGIGHVDKNVKALVFDKMVPSQENASNGTYKVTRLLFMNTKGAPEGITKAFIDYIYTPEGTEIIKKSGYIPTGRQ